MLNPAQQHEYIKLQVEHSLLLVQLRGIRDACVTNITAQRKLEQLDQTQDYSGKIDPKADLAFQVQFPERIITNEDELPPKVEVKPKLKVGDVILYSRSLMFPEKVHGEVLVISTTGHIYVTVLGFSPANKIATAWIELNQIIAVLEPGLL